MALPMYNDAYTLLSNDSQQFQMFRRWVDEANPHPVIAMQVAKRIAKLALYPEPDYPDYDMGPAIAVRWCGCIIQPANDPITPV